jgi:hypothetical protein
MFSSISLNSLRFRLTRIRYLNFEITGIDPFSVQFCPNLEKVTPEMRPVGEGHIQEADPESDRLVADPFAAHEFWMNTAETNTEAFAKVFRCIPSKEVEGESSSSPSDCCFSLTNSPFSRLEPIQRIRIFRKDWTCSRVDYKCRRSQIESRSRTRSSRAIPTKFPQEW